MSEIPAEKRQKLDYVDTLENQIKILKYQLAQSRERERAANECIRLLEKERNGYIARAEKAEAEVKRLREALVEIASYRFGALPAIAGKALAAKPKAPSEAEEEAPNDA